MFIAGRQEIAWVTNTSDPVCVFTINAGRNAGYYRENPQSSNHVFDLQCDGFTSTATNAWRVQPLPCKPEYPFISKS